MKKQTAVEWFIEEMKKLNILVPEESAIKLGELIVETKEMEREQIEEAYQMGREGLTITEFNETFEP